MCCKASCPYKCSSGCSVVADWAKSLMQEMEARRPRLQGHSAQSAQPKQAPAAGSAPLAQAAPEAVRKPETQHAPPSTSVSTAPRLQSYLHAVIGQL